MPVRRRESGARARVLAKLFFTMLSISAMTFGGGFVIVTLMKRRFVDEYGWLSEREMLDYTALAQSCPGAIAVNAAILTGWRVAGAAGMFAAVAGTVVPPLVILSLISVCYGAFASNPYVAMALSGMQAGVAAVIADVVMNLGARVLQERSAVRTAVMLGAFVAVYVFHAGAAPVLLAAAAVGVCMQLCARGKEGRT